VLSVNTRGARMKQSAEVLLQDGRSEEDVQRPLNLVGEAESRPACGRNLTGRGVLRGSGPVPGD